MKPSWTFFIILIICIYGCSPSSGQPEVPAAVKSKFASLYADVKNPEWEIEDGKYESSFKVNQIATSILFNADGSVVQTETEITGEALPQAVRDYVRSQLGDKKIAEAAKIITISGVTSYEAEVDKTDYLFDSNGQYVGVEEKEAGEKEDNN